MMRFTLIFVAAATGVLWVSASVGSRDVRDVLSRWEKDGVRMSTHEIRLIANDAREQITKGDLGAVRRLMGILNNQAQPLLSRREALTVACEVADDQGAHLILDNLEAIRTAAIAMHDTAEPEEFDRAWRWAETISRVFVKQGAEHLVEVMKDQERLLAFVQAYYTNRLRVDETRGACLRLIATCKVPYAVREKAIIAVIDSQHKNRAGGASESLVDLLQPSAFPALRRLVRAGTTAQEFHFPAAYALAQLGDREVIPDLEAFRPKLNARYASGDDYIDHMLSLIEIKHDPTLLLDRIANASDRDYSYSAIWALTRAHQVGVDPALIREAIITYAKKVSKERERTQLLRAIVRTALELEILKPTDLPKLRADDKPDPTP